MSNHQHQTERGLEPKLKPRLAVVIPAYNMRSRYGSDEEFTGVLMHYKELSEQYPEVEFHVVDDGSKDNSQVLMGAFSEDAPAMHFHYMPQNAQKIGAIKHVVNNLGANIDSILHTDFDCRFTEGALDNALAQTKELEQDQRLGGFGLRVVPENPRNLLEIFQEWEYALGRFSYVLSGYEGKTRCVGGAGGLWKRRVYEDQLENHSGMFISEDMEQTALIMRAGYKIGYARDVTLTTKVPKQTKALLKQRIRWAKGAMYSYYNVKDFYLNQATKFIPRKSMHGLLTAIQMFKIATTPCWVAYTAEKLYDQDVSAGIYIYSLGTAVNVGMSILSYKEFDHKFKSLAMIPVYPLIEYGLYLSAHTAAYYQFMKEMYARHSPKLKDIFQNALQRLRRRFSPATEPATAFAENLSTAGLEARISKNEAA